jgi:UbiD family decarboxylase
LKKTSASLYDLPIVTHIENDAGPFITSSIVFSKDQESGKENQSTLTTKVGIDATATILKAKERFEISKIPVEEKVVFLSIFRSGQEIK